MIGIYCVKNKINGKEYVGQSIDIGRRIYDHQKRALDYPEDRSHNSILHQAIRKYGWENFEVSVLEECSVDLLDEKEKYYIESKNTLAKNGYNILSGGQANRLNIEKHFCKCGERKTPSAKTCLKCHLESIKSKVTVDFNFIVRCLDSNLEQVAKELGYTSGNGLKKLLNSNNYPSKREDMFAFFERETGEKHLKQKEKEEKERVRTENAKARLPKEVHQYSREGQYIKTFSSFREAAKAVGTHSGPISEVVQGKRKTAGGFIWKLEKV